MKSQQKPRNTAGWIQEALFNRTMGSYFNPIVKSILPGWDLAGRGQLARVLEIQKHNDNAVTLKIQAPDSWSGFIPGQYVTCEFEIDGVRRKRNYSISSSASLFEKLGQFEICVHRVDGGVVSNFILDRLRLDTLFAISEAQGEFARELQTRHLNGEDAQKKPVLFLAAGSGITPMRSLLSSGQHADAESFLIYSTANQASQVFSKAFKALDETQEQFHFFAHTTREHEGDKRLDAESISSLCPQVKDCEIFICGSNSFTQAMIEALTSLGVNKDAIHFESFDSVMVHAGSVSQESQVHFSRSGKTAKDSQAISVLEQAENLSLNPKNACRMGVCHSCTCTKKSGVVRNMLTGELSSPDEEEIRICISQAVGDVEIEL